MNNLPQFNLVDIGIMLYLAIGLIRGARKGLSGELAGLISAVVAFFAGWRFYQSAGSYLLKVSRLSIAGSNALAFVVVIVGAYVLMIILRILLRQLMEFSFKGKIETLGGALAGVTRSSVVAAVLILVVGLWPHEYLHRLFAEESVIGKTVYVYLGPVYENLSQKYPALRMPTALQPELDQVVKQAAGETESPNRPPPIVDE